jgi:hypothetical protein
MLKEEDMDGNIDENFFLSFDPHKSTQDKM